ncbi:hypothetical protein BS50DRAFT_664986 [Corynespora cassiicola Philippines]|uniref:Zn(2)-C6 fungal-type domain-containing protein n=1 Tax=Corynespora cassiicola Philippines TaxID=1448308 RepID=A0A2T2NQG7_CORCC|nr:hypothetical protein BS50DRAFT_664986 [Corynespora cassiicola Philippines]
MARWPEALDSSDTTISAADAPPESLTAGRDEAAKRPRACDGCRAAKVRCVLSSPNTSSPSCPRCLKAGKTCITSPAVGPRKKRKKAVNRVLELEKKIDLLTASLCAKNDGQPFPIDSPELRETRPTLFLAIMAAASYDEPDLQRKLVGELTRAFAEKIIVGAEKSFELIQALQISITWTWLPDYLEEFQFYQQVHISTAMAIELGLGRRLPQKRATPYGNHAFPRKNQGSQASMSIDPTSLEARRAWLACYYLSSTMTIMKRRPLLLTWTRFMEESYELLRTAPERAPTDEYFCAHIWAHHLSEDVAQQIASDDFDDPANAARLAFTLRKVDRDLSQFHRYLPDGFVRESLSITFGVIPLYFYGVALHCDFVDGKREEQQSSQPSPLPTALPSVTLPDTVTLSKANISTVTSCLLNVRTVTEAFLAMNADTMRCLPTINYGRVVLAGAMLFKLYIFVDQDSNLAAVIQKDQLGVGPCLDRLVRQFQLAAAGRCCRPASRMLGVLLAIKDSFSAYCTRQGSNNRYNTKDQALHSSQNPPSQSVPISRQEWLPQHQHHQPATPTHDQGNSVTSTLTEFSGAPSQSYMNGTGLTPWDGDFFTAALSVEEFSYSLGINLNGEELTDYCAVGGNGMSSDVNMQHNSIRNVELASMSSNSNGLASASWTTW